MKNFFGRILILIVSAMHVVMFFVVIGVFIFYLLDSPEAVQSFFNGGLHDYEYAGVILSFVDFIVFSTLTVICIMDIIKARSMKHTLIASIFCFCINLATFLTNLLIPHYDNIYVGLYLGLSGTLIATSIIMVLGSFFNFYKDCR